MDVEHERRSTRKSGKALGNGNTNGVRRGAALDWPFDDPGASAAIDNRPQTSVRWRWVSTALGRMLIASRGKGLCFLGLDDERALDGLEAWAARHAPGACFAEAGGELERVAQQLQAYAAGELARFDLELDLCGPAFHRQVWARLLAIPFGHTATYGQVAAALGRAGGARAVGQAAGANPVPVVVPCHRLLARSGLGGFTGGLDLKQRLLAHEGALLSLAP